MGVDLGLAFCPGAMGLDTSGHRAPGRRIGLGSSPWFPGVSLPSCAKPNKLLNNHECWVLFLKGHEHALFEGNTLLTPGQMVPITIHQVHLTCSDRSFYRPMMLTKWCKKPRISGFNWVQLRLLLSTTCHWRVLNIGQNQSGSMLSQTLVQRSPLPLSLLHDKKYIFLQCMTVFCCRSRDTPFFGRSLCFNSNEELYRWLAAMMHAQVRSGIMSGCRMLVRTTVLLDKGYWRIAPADPWGHMECS